MRKKSVTYISRHSNEILEDVKNGKTLKEVSEKFECATSTVYALLRKNGYVRGWRKNDSTGV
jgi:Mor family transcriptional regulator